MVRTAAGGSRARLEHVLASAFGKHRPRSVVTKAAVSGWKGCTSVLHAGGCSVTECEDRGSRSVSAEITVYAPPAHVWAVLTDYDSLADVVPNLEKCECLPSKQRNTVLLYQKAFSQTVFWRVEASALLQLTAHESADAKELRFEMVSGDFRELHGRWVVTPKTVGAGQQLSVLRYEITAVPKAQPLEIPQALMSYLLKQSLPANISALAARAEQFAEPKQRGLLAFLGSDLDDTPGASISEPLVPQPVQPLRDRRPGGTDSRAVSQRDSDRASSGARTAGADAAAASRAGGASAADAAERARSGDQASTSYGLGRETGRSAERARGADATKVPWRRRRGAVARRADAPGWDPERRPEYLGVSSVPLPGQRLDDDDEDDGAEASVRQVGQPISTGGWLADTGDDRSNAIRESLRVAQEAPEMRYPPIEVARGLSAGEDAPAGEQVDKAALQELEPGAQVHIRRLDTATELHRRVLASVEVDAPSAAVWAILTAYEALPQVVPSLVVSEVVAPRGQRQYPPGMTRLRQLAVKRLPYVELHTEVVLDVVEKRGDGGTHELQFRQYDGDFDMLQGKWVVEPGRFVDGRETTVLKYAIEMAIHARPSRALGLIEPLLERSMVTDLPANLACIKVAAEGGSAGSATTGRAPRRTFGSFEELRAELVKLYGHKQELPSRRELRDAGRYDLETAVTDFGGFRAVAEALQWSTKRVKRRPRGYWQSLENVQTEIDLFIDEHGLEQELIPAKSKLRQHKRTDIVKAIEKKGGFKQVAGLLGYKTQSSGTSGPQRFREDDEDPRLGVQLLEQASQALARGKRPALSETPSVADLLEEGRKLVADSSSAAPAGSRSMGDKRAAPGSPERGAPETGPGAESDGAAAPTNAVGGQAQQPRPRGARGSGQGVKKGIKRKMMLSMRDIDVDVGLDKRSGGSGRRWSSNGYGRPPSRMLSQADIDKLLSEPEGFRDSIS